MDKVYLPKLHLNWLLVVSQKAQSITDHILQNIELAFAHCPCIHFGKYRTLIILPMVQNNMLI